MMIEKNAILLDNFEKYGDILQCFKLRHQIIESGAEGRGQGDGKRKLVFHWHLLSSKKKVQDEIWCLRRWQNQENILSQLSVPSQGP